LSITLGSRIDFDEMGRPRPGPAVKALLRQVADQLRRHDELRLRIMGHTPRGDGWNTDLYESAHQGALVFGWLQRLGVDAQRMSLWGWGSARPLVRSDPASSANRAIVLELIPDPDSVSGTVKE
jgi:outer membrane protein OmpA-like peptidoglycan-associated protein